MREWLQKRSAIIWGVAGVVGVTATFQWWMGRALFGPDGKFGLWEGSIRSQECSQRFADAYSFSHIGHGLVFFALLWLFAARHQHGHCPGRPGGNFQ
jgi:hypothetical protein